MNQSVTTETHTKFSTHCAVIGCLIFSIKQLGISVPKSKISVLSVSF